MRDVYATITRRTGHSWKITVWRPAYPGASVHLPLPNVDPYSLRESGWMLQEADEWLAELGFAPPEWILRFNDEYIADLEPGSRTR